MRHSITHFADKGTVVLFLGQLFYTLRGAWRHGTKSSKLDVSGMTSNCLMRQSKCVWKVVNQMPKTIPIDFPAYQKCIGICHQQLEICGIGFTPFPSISTKIWCDGICSRANMNQRWYVFLCFAARWAQTSITSWPSNRIAWFPVSFQCHRTLCKNTCSVKLSLWKKPTDRSRLLWFRMSKCERCRFGEDGRIRLLVWESFVTWHSRVLREIGTQGEHPQGETLGPGGFLKWGYPKIIQKIGYPQS